MVRIVATALPAPYSSKQCLLAATRYGCLQQRSQQQQQLQHLQDRHRVLRHASDLRRYEALSRLNLGRLRAAETAPLLAWWWLWGYEEGDYKMPRRSASIVDMGP